MCFVSVAVYVDVAASDVPAAADAADAVDVADAGALAFHMIPFPGFPTYNVFASPASAYFLQSERQMLIFKFLFFPGTLIPECRRFPSGFCTIFF